MLTFLFGKTTPSLIQIRFISTDFKSYLIKNCDFSHEKALFASRKLHFQSSSNPDAVLTLLTSYGFSHSDISKITARYPSLLLSNPDQTLKPKLDFFNSRGLSGDDLVKVISKDHRLLMSNLETTIIPCFDFLRTIIQTDDGIFTMLKRSTNILRTENEKTLAPKITLLRVHGVSDSNISKTLVSHPRVFTINISRFTEIIAQAKKMEFDPGQYTFLMAVNVLASMSKSSLEAKFDAYRSWGLSEDELRSAFRKTPNCVILSKESIMLKMDYFVNKMGYAPSSVAKQPSVLIYSLERRIIPRCSVIQVLVTNGLVKKAPTLCSFLTWPEKMFLKYISRFGKEVTGLMDAYQKGKDEWI